MTNFTQNVVDAFMLADDWSLNSVNKVLWSRYSNVEDEFGRSSNITLSFSKLIDLIVQPLTEEDRKVIGLGLGVTGYMKAYAKTEYNGDSVDVGDVLVNYDNKSFLVTEVHRWGGRSEVFRKLILRMIDND